MNARELASLVARKLDERNRASAAKAIAHIVSPSKTKVAPTGAEIRAFRSDSEKSAKAVRAEKGLEQFLQAF
jgi:hypothetical protein